MTITVQQAIDAIIAAIPGAPFSDTVDTIKLGDASQELTGIAVTFLTTSEVIQKAAQLGANLIVTHEPTFYNHRDDTNWLHAHDIYNSKRRLIENDHLVVWRFHDYLHSLPPDSTVMGLLKELGWEANVSIEQPWLSDIQPITFRDMGEHIKQRLGLKTIRLVGDLTSVCKRAAVLPGFPPAEMQIGVLGDPSVDVLIAGEIHEWETSEYARDANLLGYQKGLIVIGHAASEEPGMRYIIPWLKERLPDISIQFVSSGSPFQYL